MTRSRYPSGSGTAAAAASEVSWNALVVTPEDLVNTGGILDAGSDFDGTNGWLQLLYASHASSQAGYQNANLARWTALLSDVLAAAGEEYDPLTDELQLMIEGPGRGHLLNEDGVFFGLFDSATVDANLQGACGAWRCSTTSVDVAGRFTETSITPFRNNLAIDAMLIGIKLGYDGTDYEGTLEILGRAEGSNRWELLTGTQTHTLRGSEYDAGNWVLGWGAWHHSTGNVDGVFQVQRLLWRVIPGGIKDAPTFTPASKPTSGTFVVVIIGDSIGDGYGADPTGDGSDGLSYGGATIPGTTTVVDSGSTLATWPDSGANAAPNPGIMPHVAEAALAAGFSAVTIVRHAVTSAPTSAIHSTHLPALLDQLAAEGLLGTDVHLAVNLSGTNDSQSGEAAAFETACENLAEAMAGVFPNARIVWVGPGAVDGPSYEDADEVRAFISTRMGTRSNWSYVDATPYGLNDTSHPSLQGYADIGDAVYDAYEAAS